MCSVEARKLRTLVRPQVSAATISDTAAELCAAHATATQASAPERSPRPGRGGGSGAGTTTRVVGEGAKSSRSRPRLGPAFGSDISVLIVPLPEERSPAGWATSDLEVFPDA